MAHGNWTCSGLALALALGILLGGCGDNDSNLVDDDDSNSFTTEPPVLTVITATIGPEGGSLVGASGTDLEGFRLDVPAGALPSATEVRVSPTLDDAPLPTLAERVGLQLRIEPTGTALAVPARVTLPLDAAHLARLSSTPAECDAWTRRGPGWERREAVGHDATTVTVEIASFETTVAGVSFQPVVPTCSFFNACAGSCENLANGFCVDTFPPPSVAPDTAARFLVTPTDVVYFFTIGNGERRGVVYSATVTSQTTTPSQPLANVTNTPQNLRLDGDGSLWAGFFGQGNARFHFGGNTPPERYDFTNLSERGNALGVTTTLDGTFVRMLSKGSIRRAGGTFQPFVPWRRDLQIDPFFAGDTDDDRRLIAKARNDFLLYQVDLLDGSRSLAGTATTTVSSFEVSPASPETVAFIGRFPDESVSKVYVDDIHIANDPPRISGDPAFTTLSWDAGNGLWLAELLTPEVYRLTVDGFLQGVVLTSATPGTQAYNCAIPRQVSGRTGGRGVIVLTTCGTFLRVRPAG